MHYKTCRIISFILYKLRFNSQFYLFYSSNNYYVLHNHVLEFKYQTGS